MSDQTTEKRSLSMYLAGPITNCNDKQQTVWRREITSKLAELGHKCIDPTRHTDWRALREMLEIDRSDVVIANLWRESVGTVIGIVQARRKGKPVILIDPNYLENITLRHLVGEEFIVHSIDKAINLLPRIVEELNKVVLVKKSNGALEPFKSSKLHDSLNAVCARAHVEDAILPDLVANVVHRKVMKAERNGEIYTHQIKAFVFDALGDIATDNLYEEELKKRAIVLSQAWDEYELAKRDQRWALQRIEELEQQLRIETEEVQALKAQNISYKSELDDLRRSLREYERQTKADGTAHAETPVDDLGKDYANYFPNLTFSDSTTTSSRAGKMSPLRRSSRWPFATGWLTCTTAKTMCGRPAPRLQGLCRWFSASLITTKFFLSAIHWTRSPSPLARKFMKK